MRQHPHIFTAIKQEMVDWRLWLGRALVLVYAAIAGLTIVAFTWLGENALRIFHYFQITYWWSPLIWTPLSTAGIV
jgi:hypothetical protein